MQSDSPLGQATTYIDTYTPSLLCSLKRREVTFEGKGEDVWTGYEFSWLNTQGKPEVAAVRLRINCESDCIVESKSMKLYLGSFAQTKFETRAEVLNTLDQDLAMAFRAPVIVELLNLEQLPQTTARMPGRCIDALDIRVQVYEPNARLLSRSATESQVHETLHSHLFRSLCPVTGQPDWASLAVEYQGAAIDEGSLLKYLVSYRSHAAFHEACIEQIYRDINLMCEPESLSVYGRFQRRGGLDINPYRSSYDVIAPDYRLHRQ
ncbi:MAG: NADPH-dependent 7-cyano-7-deazaguanine reductase QueF [Pseudomonadales bacterium]|nr:NADPH-dependent 7-cyano-7-deazaguanine reductase QueF [Pseudomonadales bacterium]